MTVTVRHRVSLQVWRWCPTGPCAGFTCAITASFDDDANANTPTDQKGPCHGIEWASANNDATYIRREFRCTKETTTRKPLRRAPSAGWQDGGNDENARTSCRSGGETVQRSTTGRVQGICPICGNVRIVGTSIKTVNTVFSAIENGVNGRRRTFARASTSVPTKDVGLRGLQPGSVSVILAFTASRSAEARRCGLPSDPSCTLRWWRCLPPLRRPVRVAPDNLHRGT